MKNLIMTLIILSLNLSVISIYAMGNSGNMGGGNNGNNGNNGQGGGNANAGGNKPNAQANKNKNKDKNKDKNQSTVRKRETLDNSRIYRVLEFCKKNKEACGTIKKQIIRTDEEKRLIAIELIETINRYRENNNQK